MTVPILQQGGTLIASLQEAQGDTDLDQLRERLLSSVTQRRASGVVLDVSAVDVMDSYAVRTLRTIAHAAHLCGARTVIVGIQPAVAFAMTQLGVGLTGISTALDLEDGLLTLQGTGGPGADR